MEKKKKINSTLAIALAILMLASISCITTRSEKSDSVPFVASPDPLDSEGNSVVTFDAQTDTVIVPLWYWKKLVEYVQDTQDIQSIIHSDK